MFVWQGNMVSADNAGLLGYSYLLYCSVTDVTLVQLPTVTDLDFKLHKAPSDDERSMNHRILFQFSLSNIGIHSVSVIQFEINHLFLRLLPPVRLGPHVLQESQVITCSADASVVPGFCAHVKQLLGP
jgi:hypothetical protein